MLGARSVAGLASSALKLIPGVGAKNMRMNGMAPMTALILMAGYAYIFPYVAGCCLGDVP
jgi:hypothetical protein